MKTMTPEQLDKILQAIADRYTTATMKNTHGLLTELDMIRHGFEHALSWAGVIEFIDGLYPVDIFTGESGDPGPQMMVLLRTNRELLLRCERLQAQHEEERLAWERLKIHALAGVDLRQAVEEILASTDSAAWDDFEAAVDKYDKWGDRAADATEEPTT